MGAARAKRKQIVNLPKVMQTPFGQNYLKLFPTFLTLFLDDFLFTTVLLHAKVLKKVPAFKWYTAYRGWTRRCLYMAL